MTKRHDETKLRNRYNAGTDAFLHIFTFQKVGGVTAIETSHGSLCVFSAVEYFPHLSHLFLNNKSCGSVGLAGSLSLIGSNCLTVIYIKGVSGQGEVI